MSKTMLSTFPLIEWIYQGILAITAAAIFIGCKPVPLEGPIEGTPILLGGTLFNLADVGYQQSEFFVTGKARSFASSEPLQSDGKWSVNEADNADFRTRILVYRPIDDTKFNGTVIIEWLNVSGGLEAPPQWILSHTELVRSGYAWVGVSAQKAGIDGGGIELASISAPLKKLNPHRYGALVHPGDRYAYDIFTAAAKAVLQPGWYKPLGDLKVERAIASGQSQSADFLLTYVNALAPVEKLFDGYFIHSRIHGSKSLSPEQRNTMEDVASRQTVRVRDDLNVPVIIVETESDLLLMHAYADRQPDSDTFRLWEIAGTAHADNYLAFRGLLDEGGDPATANVVETNFAVPLIIDCGKPINSGPHHFVVKAAVSALDRWLRTGIAPPTAERLAIDEATRAFVKDDVGNVLGGIRTPHVDVPTAVLSGEGQNSNEFCSLFGTTRLLSQAQLSELYTDHDVYISAIKSSIDRAVQQGFLLEPDGELIEAAARASNVGQH